MPKSAANGSDSYSTLWLVYFIFSIGVLGVFVAYCAYIPLYFVGRIWPRREPQLTALENRVLCRGINRLMSLQPWFRGDIRIDSQALEKRVQTQNPPRGYLIVSNHRSHLDAFILLWKIPGIRILAKQSLFYVPFLGAMMRASRQIPVARNINSFFAAMDEVRKRLREQNIVHVFPEMTRCEPRMAGTQNFSALPFAIAIQEKVLILPVVFRDTDATWPKNRFGLCFRKPVQAWTLAPVDAAQFTSSEELRTSVRRLITEALNNPPLPQEGAR